MRRLIVFIIATLAFLGGSSAAQAIVSTPASGGYWGCVGSELLDRGVCVRNPVPERLPVPKAPSVPSTPPAPTPA